MKYIALFRGINVGGKHIVKMNDLKQFLFDLGLQQVQTYIQSGNAIFETTLDAVKVQKMIHTGFAERFEFESSVIIRSLDEIAELIAGLPITAAELEHAQACDPKVEHLYVYFLDQPPEQAQIDSICNGYSGEDMVRAGAKEVYLLCHSSIRDSKLATRTAKLFESATVRNWKTVQKLYEMLCFYY